MANTYTYKVTFAKQYQEQLFRQPVYRALSREAIVQGLYQGQTMSRSYLSRFAVGELSAAGGYTVQNFTSTAEVLTIDHKPFGAFRIVEWQKFLDDLDTQDEASTFCMNEIFNYTDGLILQAIVTGAGSTIDNATFGGVSGDGIVVSLTNARAISAFAQGNLIAQNAFTGRFNATKRFSGIKQRDGGERMPVLVIPYFYWTQLILSLSARWTPAGDKVTTNGFMDMIDSFNIFVSNNLPWKGIYDVSASNLSNGDTLVFGGLTFTGVTGTPTAEGDFKIEAAAADTATNLKNAINSPYTSISGKSVAFTQANLASNVQTMLAMTVATSSGTAVTVKVAGNSVVIATTTSVTGSWTKKICYAIAGTSEMVDVAIAKDVFIGEPIPVPGTISKDIVPHSLLGFKVFHDQSPRIVSIALDTSAITTAPAY